MKTTRLLTVIAVLQALTLVTLWKGDAATGKIPTRKSTNGTKPVVESEALAEIIAEAA